MTTTSADHLLSLAPQALARQLKERGIRRFFLVTDAETGQVRASHDELAPLAGFLERDAPDFAGHEGLFFQVSRAHDTLQGAFVHNTVRGQAAGGVRHWRYETVADYLRDGLRLAVGMTRKNALAGLWWGGGKGVMARSPDLDPADAGARAAIYREYGELMTSLRGCYVTAEDVGTRQADMAEVFARTRFTTCIPETLGGSGNPSVPTARGVICGMEAAFTHLEGDRGDDQLRGKTVAVQGLGHVGAALVGFLLERGVARVVATDVDAEAVARVRARHPDAPLETRLVALDDRSIFDAEVDVFAPCATGAILDQQNIGRLRARVVCGAANNQLDDPLEDDRRLAARGIVYVPDFLVNRMGIVTCADEQAGYLAPDPLIERHLGRDWERSIYRSAVIVLEIARATGKGPSRVATARADALAREPHPIFGHRGRAIIDGLVASGWHRDG